ncbi:MAG TPA: ABC transporter permease [Candidatus Acidoferrales bacterium]|nr:ABC transporter permease [Candidatus Acidoferrales bacterium]
MNGWRDRLALDLRAARARAFVRVVGTLREPQGVLLDAVFPNLGMCAYVLLYRGLGAPRSFETLAVIGGIMTTFWLNVLWGMGAQLFWEKQSGQLQLFFAAPCSRMAILAGMAVGGLVGTTLRSLVGVALGVWVFHVRFASFSPGVLIAVFLATMAALYALGMMLASLFLLYGREAWHTCNALTDPVFMLSGLYFPIRTLGSVGAFAAGLLPLALGVDALRQVLMGPAAHGLFPVRYELAGLCALAVLLLVLARLSLEHLERLSKREGRLTQRWQ